MYCKHCGNKLVEGSKFCNNCGKTADESPREKSPESNHSEARNESGENKNPGSIAAVIITTIVATAILLWIMSSINSYSHKSSSATDQLAPSTTAAVTPASDQQHAQPAVPSAAAKPKSVTGIVAEWRDSTAYVDCTFGSLANRDYQEMWGSGLLTFLNSEPTVITNRHVVDNGRNNLDYCAVKFPDTIYSVGYQVAPENVSYASNGEDVAYLTFTLLEKNLSQQKDWDSYSLTDRSKNGTLACKQLMNIGDPVIILGYPVEGSVSSLNYYNENIEVTATEGIISGTDGIYYTTSAKVDHGNSGGLAIDETNNCYFGIPTWAASGGFSSLGRILPASTFLHY